ncbi:MAG: type II secretion system protein [Dehalococcoidia bacterium]|nr:type II secretion system protein [Dehalococcoidia bacterium]
MKIGTLFKRFGSRKGFTLVELMVVMAILGVLVAIVVPAVSGTKSVSLEGQVASDGNAAQTAVSNYNNKAMAAKQFPSQLPTIVTTPAHRYADVWAVGTGAGAGVTLMPKVGTTALGTLATKIQKSGTTGDTNQVYEREFVVFNAATDVWDSSGLVKAVKFVPDFLIKDPGSLVLMGDETKKLGDSGNTYDEFLWLLKVVAPGTDAESRSVEVFRLTGVTWDGTVTTTLATMTYTQVF